MMESIEKLREWAQKYGPMGSHDPLAFADEIEREISERYMPRPVDTNGEPWGEADKAFYANGENFARRLAGFSYAFEEGRWLLEDGDCCTFYADECRHANPDHIKRLLEEFAACATTNAQGDVIFSGRCIDEYTDKLHELLGGDES